MQRTYKNEEWLKFLIDYNPENLDCSEDAQVLVDIQDKTASVLNGLLDRAGYDLEQFKKKDWCDSYSTFLCYCSYVGHGINLITELDPNISKIYELDKMLSDIHISDDMNAYIRHARSLLYLLDNVVNELDDKIVLYEVNSPNYDPENGIEEHGAPFSSAIGRIRDNYFKTIENLFKEI
jgi:hypothetical protein